MLKFGVKISFRKYFFAPSQENNYNKRVANCYTWKKKFIGDNYAGIDPRVTPEVGVPSWEFLSQYSKQSDP
jgi:hypothetical protein